MLFHSVLLLDALVLSRELVSLWSSKHHHNVSILLSVSSWKPSFNVLVSVAILPSLEQNLEL
jgi:hypothetical protein